MAFIYEEVVPWGRSFDEYLRMFALIGDEPGLKIIGCGDGPAGFNAGAFKKGGKVVSCDPLYMFSARQIKQRIEATYDNVISQTRENREKFVWHEIPSIEELGRVRMSAMNEFLGDYEEGQRAGRYIPAELPNLPFRGLSFDLALCSHFLFLYSDNLGLSFHVRAAEEMCRAAKEARIFPVLDYNGDRSRHAGPLMDALAGKGYSVSIEKVPYEFQRGGDQMMRISAPPAKITGHGKT